jgi:hypothetical protein
MTMIRGPLTYRRCIALAALLLAAAAMPASACDDSQLDAALLAAYPDARLDARGLEPAGESMYASRRDVQCKRWPAQPELLLLAVPLQEAVAEHGDTRPGDLEVIVADAATGAVRARARERGRLDSDAWYFAGVSLDTARYQLTGSLRAFGTRVRFTGSSRVNPSSKTALTLYVLHGNALEPVLRDLPVDRYGGEWDGNCSGEFARLERTVAVAPSQDSTWADLVIRSRATDIVARDEQGECTRSESTTRSTERVRHDGTGYPVSAGLADWSPW